MPGIGDYENSSYGYDGWDPPEDYSKFRGGGSGGGDGAPRRGPFRFKVPEPKDNPIEPGKGARKRVLIIGVPFYMWEHSTFGIPGAPRGVFNAICRKQNRIEDECPVCDAEKWPSYGAYFTIIDLGFVRYEPDGGATLFPDTWIDKKDGKRRESQFQRRLMVAKKGGKENPGQLTFFEDQRNRRGGDLTGCVFDTLRTGGKKAQIGDQWEFVERITGGIEAMKQYILNLGADPEYVAKEWVFQRFTVKDVEEHGLFTNAEMAHWVGSAPAGDRGRDEGRREEPSGGRPAARGRTEGAGYGTPSSGASQGTLAGTQRGRPSAEDESQFKNDPDFRGGNS